VERPLSSEGGQADITVIRDGEGREYVLTLYREALEPTPGVMGKLVELSKSRSPYVVNTYPYSPAILVSASRPMSSPG
jgi:hypothetical protein